MPVAVRDEFRSKVSQITGNIMKVGDADGQNNPFCFNDLTIIHCEFKSAGYTFKTYQELVFEFRYDAFLKGYSISRECFQTYRESGVAVRDALLRTKLLERETAFRVANIRRETVRFEQHSFWHVGLPAVHQPAKDSEADTEAAQMR